MVENLKKRIESSSQANGEPIRTTNRISKRELKENFGISTRDFKLLFENLKKRIESQLQQLLDNHQPIEESQKEN